MTNLTSKKGPKFLKTARSGARKSAREVSTRVATPETTFLTLFRPPLPGATPGGQLWVSFRVFSGFFDPWQVFGPLFPTETIRWVFFDNLTPERRFLTHLPLLAM